MSNFLSPIEDLFFAAKLESSIWRMVVKARKRAQPKPAKKRKMSPSDLSKRYDQKFAYKRSWKYLYRPATPEERRWAIGSIYEQSLKDKNGTAFLEYLRSKVIAANELLHKVQDVSTRRRSYPRRKETPQDTVSESAAELLRQAQLVLEKTEGLSEKHAEQIEKSSRALEKRLDERKVKIARKIGPPSHQKHYEHAEARIEEIESKADAAMDNIRLLLSHSYIDKKLEGPFGLMTKSVEEQEEFAQKAKDLLRSTLESSAQTLKDNPDPSEMKDLFIIVKEVKSLRDQMNVDSEDSARRAEEIDSLIDLWMERLEVLVKEQADKIRQAQS